MDDPEKRIAELERQLAEQEHATGAPSPNGRHKWKVTRFALPAPGCLTAEQVRHVAFSKPPLGKSGYNEDEVDAFLDLVEAELRQPTGTLGAEQVRGVAFGRPPLGRRGYNEDEVDTFLGLVEQQLRTQRGADPAAVAPPPPGGPPATHAATPQSPGRRLLDAGAAVFGSFWLWYLLGFVLLAGGGAGLRFLGRFVPLDGPAPSWMGLVILAMPVVAGVCYVVWHLRSRDRRRHRYWAAGGGDGGSNSGCSGGHGGCGGGSGCGGGGCGGGGH